MTGDLTHDGEPETVVLYTIEGQGGSNLYIQYLAVFAQKNGKLTPLTHADVGGKRREQSRRPKRRRKQRSGGMKK